MRLIVLLLAASVLAGCRGTDGKKRDYLSVNRASLAFLKETRRESTKLRRENLKQDFQFGRREKANRYIRRTSRKYAVSSFFTGTWREAENTAKAFWEEVRWSGRELKVSTLFGHLDTGDP